MSDTIIVGAGLIGMLTARELLAAGEGVTLLDRVGSGRESSWAGGGILSPLFPWRYPDPVTELARWSQGRYRQLAEELAQATGIDPEWTRNGMLMLDLSAEESERARKWADRFGYRLESLEGDALRECEPALGTGTRGLWMPEVAQIRNPRLLKSLRRELESKGAQFREECAVREFRAAGGRLQGLETEVGYLPAERVVVAGGAWSGRLLEAAGVTLPVEPVRGQMVLLHGEPGQVSRIVLSQERYIIPRRDGRVLVGSTMERVGFDKSTSESARAGLTQAACRTLPVLCEAPVELHWAGLRPGSPAGIPFIGPVPGIGGLYVNAGHFRNGVVTGPASARLLADVILGRTGDISLFPYHPGHIENTTEE